MIELIKQLVEALEAMQSYAEAERKGLRICDEAIQAGKQAIKELESQEPVAWEQFHGHMAGPFYQEPPQRTWVGSGDLEESNAYLVSPQRTEEKNT